MDKTSLTQHISQQFNSEMANLKEHLLVMGGIVEQQVQNAVTALVEHDTALAEAVRERDKEVDAMERTIDAEATRVIAKRQPAASDLRLVMLAVKMVADLERIGDESKKIAKFAMTLSAEGRAPSGYVEVRHIGAHVSRMIHDALDAFARLDVAQALAVMKEDNSVDEEYQVALRSLLTFMMEDARSISRCISIMWVLRALERIGDHANNIAELVIYLVKGKDVRHVSMSEAQQVVEGG